MNNFKSNFTFLFLTGAILLFLVGCSQNNLYFHEQAKFGLTAEFPVDKGAPESTMGYKRKVTVLSPPKYPNNICNSGAKKDCIHEGEALSMISYFKVRTSFYGKSKNNSNQSSDNASVASAVNALNNKTKKECNEISPGLGTIANLGGFISVDTNFATGHAAAKLTNLANNQAKTKKDGDKTAVTQLLEPKKTCETE